MTDTKILFQLSPFLLNLFNECPRCFWFHIRKEIKRPRGIFPSLPNGMDRIIKKLYDDYRRDNELPTELRMILPLNTRLVSDIELVNKWRDWRSDSLSFTSKHGIKIIGALDDCLVDEDGVFSPLDYKTRGSAPKDPVYSEQYYGLQLSTYSFLLRESGRKVSGKGYLTYYYPAKIYPNNKVDFIIAPLEIKADPKYAASTIKTAVDVLKKDIPPERGATCEFCVYREGI